MTADAKVDEWSEKLELHKNVVSLQIGKSQDELNEILKHLPTLTGLQASLVSGVLGDGGISLSLALTKQREAARRVCVVCTPTQHLGTGFLISPQHVLTNRHVVAGASDPNQLQVVFDHIGEKPYVELVPRAVKFSSPLLASDVGDLDYAVLPLAQPVEADRGYFFASLKSSE